ncbi:MAG: hypothetical protein ABII82_18905 [Verrucomicrobiota bacterium]
MDFITLAIAIATQFITWGWSCEPAATDIDGLPALILTCEAPDKWAIVTVPLDGKPVFVQGRRI